MPCAARVGTYAPHMCGANFHWYMLYTIVHDGEHCGMELVNGMELVSTAPTMFKAPMRDMAQLWQL